jgi:predicted AlkP superfamily pyrophosphatase or phosphodiesterase
VGSAERLLVVLLDAFGMRFVDRHADHPLLRRLDAIQPLEAQFPTTTTAEMTTLHTGMPVGLHDLYESNLLAATRRSARASARRPQR